MKNLKKILRHSVPVLLAVFLFVGAVFTPYETAKATGVEELFYYTYFDLLNTLYATQGYSFDVNDEYYAKPDRVTGKQVWDNFVTFVETAAKANYKFLSDGLKVTIDELKALPDTVTVDGVTMSPELEALLADTLSPVSSGNYSNEFDCSSTESVYNLILSITGCDGYENLSSLKSSSVLSSVCSGKTLNIVHAIDNKGYYVFAYSGLIDYNSTDHYLHTFDGSGNEVQLSATNLYICYDNSKIYSSYSSISFGENYEWVVKNGQLSAALSQYVTVTKDPPAIAQNPDKVGTDNWDLWKWYLDNAATTDEEESEWAKRYDFDNNDDDDKDKKKKDNEKDKLPACIPLVFPSDKPTDTEKDTEKESESETENDPGHKPSGSESESESESQSQSGDVTVGGDNDVNDPGSIPPIADKYGNWKSLFPFCIPWDMMHLIKSMKAEKRAPKFHFEYYFKTIDYNFVVDVDMSDYWKYIKIFRWGLTIFFVIGLFFLTVKFTTFVQRMGG